LSCRFLLDLLFQPAVQALSGTLQRMTAERSAIRRYSPPRAFVGVFCLLLILFGAAAEATHTHGLSSAPHPDCSLCMVAHAGISPPAPFVLPRVAERSTRVVLLPETAPFEAPEVPFYSRPPPSASAAV
jgi:hypothetical protein